MIRKEDLTQSELKKRIKYDPETGEFTRLRDSKLGVQGINIDNKGYLRLSVACKRYRAHRLAWLYMTGQWPPDGMDVDHKNRVRNDNRWCNLRLATKAQSTYNRQDKPNKYGYIGVFRCRNGKFKANLSHNGKTYYSKATDSVLEAAKAYNELAKEHFGEFANLNEI